MKDEDLMDLVNKPKGKANPFAADRWDDPFAGDNPPGRLPTKTDALAQDILANPAPAPKPAKAAPRAAKSVSDFDALQAEIAKYEASKAQPTNDEKPKEAKPRPIDPVKAERIRKTIEAGNLPLPSWMDGISAALNPSEMALDAAGALSTVLDRTTMGVVPKAMEGIGIVPEGENARLQERLAHSALRPGGVSLASIAAETGAGAAGMLTGVPQAFGKAGANLVRSALPNAASKVPAGAMTAIDAAAAGGLYGASDAAVRGGSIGDIENAALMGSALGAGMSQLPAAAGLVEKGAHRLNLKNDLRPIKQMAKKGTLDKALLQFGDNKAAKGGQAMEEFVDRENLGPVLRGVKPEMEETFKARKNAVWEEGVGPIFDKAFQVEPKASVSMKNIEQRMRSLADRGTNESELLDSWIAKLKDRMVDAGGKGGKFPLQTLLKNARAFQSQGHAGVVNYDAPNETKALARKVGHELKLMVTDEVGRIYARNPQAARELLNHTPLEPSPSEILARESAGQPESPTLPRLRSPNDPIGESIQDIASHELGIPRDTQSVAPRMSRQPRPTVADNLLENPDIAEVGARMLAENERYSDYKKMERMVQEAAKLKKGEKKHGLISMLYHGGALTAGGLAGAALGHGAHGILPGAAAVEVGRRAYPPTMRAIESIARFNAGTAQDPQLRPTAAQIADMERAAESIIGPRKKKGKR